MKKTTKYERKHAIPCQWCDKIASIKTCGRCREINKYKMVQLLLGDDKVVLLYSQINRNGRPKKIRSSAEVAHIVSLHKELKSIRKVAEQTEKGRHYIHNVIKYAKENGLYR